MGSAPVLATVSTRASAAVRSPGTPKYAADAHRPSCSQVISSSPMPMCISQLWVNSSRYVPFTLQKVRKPVLATSRYACRAGENSMTACSLSWAPKEHTHCPRLL